MNIGEAAASGITVPALWIGRKRLSKDVKPIALSRGDELAAKIGDLTGRRNSLGYLAGCCHGDNRSDCPILDNLDRSSSILNTKRTT